MWNTIRRRLAPLDLAQRFRLASFIILVLGMIGIGYWIQREIEAGIIHGTASTTALYVESFVTPQLTELAQGKPVSQQHIQTLARLLQDTPLGKQIVAFKLWGPNGFVLYDTDQTGIGKSFAVEPRLAAAWQGQTTSRISNLEAQENVSERKLASQLLETYSPVREGGSGRIIAVAEFYQSVDELRDDIAAAQRRSWLMVAAAMLTIYVLLSGFVQRASDTIKGQRAALTTQVAQLKDLLTQNEDLHERVRRGAAHTAALNERFLRRISAELHDGPAQEISLALLRMDPGDGTGAENGDVVPDDPRRERTAGISRALRHALQEIRVISAGLSLPELEHLTLPEAINLAVHTHQRRTGTPVAVSLGSLPARTPLAVKITVYRLIQEALTNAYRHAGGAGQEVRVTGEGRELRVEIYDRGPGFDAARMADGESHLGLLGMRERVQSLGGLFWVESTPGVGTTVFTCLPLDAQEESHGG
jgi:signal transduction histidine kinase